MSDEISISVDIPKDENGMLGRECLECERLFKLKPGTGLPTDHCHCPYCDYEGNSDTFWTKAQLEYAQSVATNQAISQFLQPSIDSLMKSFRELERSTRNSLIQFSVTTDSPKLSVPVKYYSEEELETFVTCNNCGLEFAVYGVFARCPDCKKLNAFLIYEKSLDVLKKQLTISMKDDIPKDVRENLQRSILTSSVSAFDGLGKELKKNRPDLYPERPKNLFQNIVELNKVSKHFISSNHSSWDHLVEMFQVRHLYEHTMGVVDDDFIKKSKRTDLVPGRLYQIDHSLLIEHLAAMKELGDILERHYAGQ